MKNNRVQYIHENWDVLKYAREVLQWPVYKDGDRTISIAPDSENKTALIVHSDSWYDFKTGDGGDVIDLCAHLFHGGDLGAAIRDLSQDYNGPEDECDNKITWKDYTRELEGKIRTWHENLRAEDIIYLHKRRINDATIKRLQIGYNESEERLIIPYYKNGRVVYFVGRDRHDYITLNEQGEIVPDNQELKRPKYKKAALDNYNANVPWGLHSFVIRHRAEMAGKANKALEEYGLNLEKILVITEGAFDAISFEQEGFKVLSPMGGFFNKACNNYVLDLAASRNIDMVFVCFDNDSAGAKFSVSMCKNMFSRRVNFVCGVLPENVKDISEYYASGGDLFALVKNAAPGVASLASHMTDREEFKEFTCKAARFSDGADMAILFKSCKQFDSDWLNAVKTIATRCPSENIIIRDVLKRYKLKYVEKVGFYEYISGVWQSRSDNQIAKYLALELGRFATGLKLGSLIRFLRSQISCEYDFNKRNIFNFLNGVLDLETGELKPHAPEYNSSIQMKYNYDPKAKCKKWREFLSQVMAGDPEKILLLQEMAGYILFPDLRLQKCFFLMGEGGNGKSVFINVLRQVFGDENCSSVSMSNLGSQFEPIRLLNSLVNFATETETSIKEAEARFKAIVAGDKISACYKGKDFVEFNPRCVMISACNKFINSSDSTRGFLRRIMFINFTQTFEGKADNKNLTQELCEELPGIFNWCYEGYKKLMKSQAFTQTQEQDEIMREFTEIIDPVTAFFREVLADLTGQRLSLSKIYASYSEWCKESGHVPQSRQRFTRSIKIITRNEMPASVFGHSGSETTITLKSKG